MITIWGVLTTIIIMIIAEMIKYKFYIDIAIILVLYVGITLILFAIWRYGRLFPRLDFFSLRREVKKFLRNFSAAEISKVSLYHYRCTPLLDQISMREKIPTQYVLSFQCKFPNKDDFRQLAVNLHTMKGDPYREKSLRIEGIFRNVYKEKLQDDYNYLDEWQLKVLEENEKPLEVNSDPFQHWRIWPLLPTFSEIKNFLKYPLDKAMKRGYTIDNRK